MSYRFLGLVSRNSHTHKIYVLNCSYSHIQILEEILQSYTNPWGDSTVLYKSLRRFYSNIQILEEILVLYKSLGRFYSLIQILEEILQSYTSPQGVMKKSQGHLRSCVIQFSRGCESITMCCVLTWIMGHQILRYINGDILIKATIFLLHNKIIVVFQQFFICYHQMLPISLPEYRHHLCCHHCHHHHYHYHKHHCLPLIRDVCTDRFCLALHSRKD
jgi:hypothetical protein